MKIKSAFLSLVLYAAFSSSTAAGVIDDIEKNLEQKRMHKLSNAKQGLEISRFKSDGCSGGLSTGWEYFAGKFPTFSSRFGNAPPWEQCCIDHDLAYWEGATENGYLSRKQADKTLKLCVERSGHNVEKTLDPSSNEKVSLVLKITAQLMYRAVRLGGKPCTVFAWRWGYGWPRCSK